MTEIAFHPAAGIFDLMDGAEFDELVADIKANGLRLPIISHPDGRILDGRNRYRACLKANVEPEFEEWDGVGLAADFVWSLNGPRRHLDGGKKQLAAGRYAITREAEAKARQGSRTDTSSQNWDEVDFGRSVEKAAEKFDISKNTVSAAVKVLKEGAPELAAVVERGGVSVSAAADVATLPAEEQREIVARGEKEILEAAKAIRAAKARERYSARVARITEISAGNAALATERRYPVIYADPPWAYHVYNETSGAGWVAAEKYPTMPLEEICALPVPNVATDDAVLFMWTTAPLLQEAFEVLAAWGFEYKTNVVWVKHVSSGLGFYAR
jgi:MT-A70